MKNKEIESEMQRRAELQRHRQWMEVDYYRIRRKIALPLPLSEWIEPKVDVPGIPKYPWDIWILWALEDRIQSLGWAGHWSKDETLRDLARRDIAALAGWRQYAPEGDPHLAVPFSSRCLVHAAERWPWLGDSVRGDIKKACERMLDQHLPWIGRHYGPYKTVKDVLGSDLRFRLVLNIPMMAAIGLAMAARCAGHAAQAELDQHVRALLLAILELRELGHSEGVAYDGFLFDFVADWLATIAVDEREEILNHPQWPVLLREAPVLCTPGNVLNVAELGDVEPWQMPFHVSFTAKFLGWRKWQWTEGYLRQCDLSRVRSESLAAMHHLPESGAGDHGLPGAGVYDAQYAMALRSGSKPRDAAVVVAAGNANNGHIHYDNGSLVIGSAGQWLLTDPGYQQYMTTSERQFTLGPKAHNCPVINGKPQNRRGCAVISKSTTGDAISYLSLNLLASYDPAMHLQRVERHVWLTPESVIVVADVIDGPDVQSVEYNWLGHPQAAWGVTGVWIMIGGERDLWFMTPHETSSWTQIQRQKGSRGHLTRHAKLPRQMEGVYWWIFALDHPVEGTVEAGKALRLGKLLLNPRHGAALA